MVRASSRRLSTASMSADMPGYPVAAQEEWASEHVFMEHCYGAITDMPHTPTPIETVVGQIRAVGAERCIISTDAGSMKLPKQVDAMRDFASRLFDAGITDTEMDLMTSLIRLAFWTGSCSISFSSNRVLNEMKSVSFSLIYS